MPANLQAAQRRHTDYTFLPCAMSSSAWACLDPRGTPKSARGVVADPREIKAISPG